MTRLPSDLARQALGYVQKEWDADLPAGDAPAKANGKALSAADEAAKKAKAQAEDEAAAAAAAAVAEAAEAAELAAEVKPAADDDGFVTVSKKKRGGGGGGGGGGGAPEAAPRREAPRDGPPREKREFSEKRTGPSAGGPPRAMSAAATAAAAGAGTPATAAELEAALGAYDNGMIFGCKNDTFEENMQRMMFGLPRQHMTVVEKITDRTAIFLLNYSSKVMHGVFILNGPREQSCGLNLVADAWAANRNLLARANDNAPGSPFPAQARSPLRPPRRASPLPSPISLLASLLVHRHTRALVLSVFPPPHSPRW